MTRVDSPRGRNVKSDAMAIQGYVTPEEAAELTGYSAVWIRRLCQQGKIECERLGNVGTRGGSWLVKKDSLLEHKKKMDMLGSSKHNPLGEEDDR